MSIRLESRWAQALLIVLASAALWGSEYLQRGLWEPDEARYAYVAWEMRQSGDWLVPHRHGESYAHKPPLLFWLINASATAAGGEINRVTARLPSLLGTVLSLWMTLQLARLWGGPRAAWRSVGILATSFLFWCEGGMGQTDALLCGLEMSALYLLFANDRAPAVWRPLLAYVCMGLAVLTKGPVGLIVPLGAYAAATLAAGEGRALRKAHWAWGLPLALAFPLAWLVAAWLAGAQEGFLRELLFSQSLERATGSLGHPHPFYYFLWHFPLEFLPGTVFLPAAWLGLRSRPELAATRRRLLAWVVFVVAFFSLMTCKRGLYVLLAHPAAAMLIGLAWEYVPERAARRTALAGAGLLGLMGLAALGAALHPALPFAGWRLILPGLLLLGAGVWLLSVGRRECLSARWFGGFCAAMLALQLCVANVIYPALNAIKTPHELAAYARRNPPASSRLLLYRMQGEILALYAGVQGRRIEVPGQLRQDMELWPNGLFVCDEAAWSDLEPHFAPLLVPHHFHMGDKRLVWCHWGSQAADSPESDAPRR